VYIIYSLNLARPGREQQEGNYIIDTLQIYIIFLFFLVKILIINVFIIELDGKLLFRNFHSKGIESSSGKKYRGLS
jgi:hypothetical protein|tara:strand:- start:626 stop:853 length:228 start_codon:yes stop_codon:yes gene_type:complete